MNIETLISITIFVALGDAQHERVQYLLIKEDGPPTLDETKLAPECFESPSETGRCRARKLGFRYIIESNECEQFTYGGCGATPNFFKTAQDCVERCGGKIEIPVKKPKTRRPKMAKRAFRTLITSNAQDYNTSTDLRPHPVPSECEAKATEIGMCRAMLIRFRFIKDSMQCQQFIYGGCGATENIFSSGDECNQKCGGTIELMSRPIR